MIQTYKKIIPFFQLNFFGANERNVRQQVRDSITPTELAPITLKPDRIALGIAAMAAVLVIGSTALLLADLFSAGSSVLVHKLAKLFSVDRESNVPAFFSTLLLVFSSLLVTVVMLVKRQQKAPYLLHWATLSLGFLFMAFDEIAALHERLIEPMRTILGETDLGVFYFAWVVPGIALVFFLGVMFLRFWWNLPAKTRLYFLIAGSVYLGGAIGVELINGDYAEVHGKENLTYILLCTIEESLEMAGIILFVRTLLRYLADSYKTLQFRFDDSQA